MSSQESVARSLLRSKHFRDEKAAAFLTNNSMLQRQLGKLAQAVHKLEMKLDTPDQDPDPEPRDPDQDQDPDMPGTSSVTPSH